MAEVLEEVCNVVVPSQPRELMALFSVWQGCYQMWKSNSVSPKPILQSKNLILLFVFFCFFVLVQLAVALSAFC